MKNEQTQETLRHVEQWLKNKDDKQLYCQSWLPAVEPEANLIIVHGLGEHSGRYQHVAAYFVERGLAVYAFDLQGHGRSDGKRGHVARFADFYDDLELFRQQVNEWSPDKPTILYGHSMGGLIIMLYLLEYQNFIAAAILSAPPIRIKMGPPTFIKEFVPKLARLLPAFSIHSGLKPEWVSRDKKVVDAYKADALTHPHISLSLFAGMHEGGKQALMQADKITLPVFMVYGSDDKIVDGKAIETAFEKCASPDKRKMVFEKNFHEVHNDAGKHDELNALWEWMRKCVSF
ncbi:lysophospholipase [candidate division KSB1 bacterium]|nr:lysophospholipase [candidate division KSB1 bacterium]